MSKTTDRRRQQREKEKKKQLRQEKHLQRFGTGTPPPIPKRFTHTYGPDFLRSVGPLILATWSVPTMLANQLTAEGKVVSAPVLGALLLDTGASGTCISSQAAQMLGLQPTRLQRGFGAGGEHENPVYLAKLEISITDHKTGVQTMFGWEQEVQGIPDLHRHTTVMVQGAPVQLVGLLGRDILQHCRVEYEGPSGTLTVSFDLASLQGQQSRVASKPSIGP